MPSRTAPPNPETALAVADPKTALANIEATLEQQTSALEKVLHGDLERAEKFKVTVVRAIAKDPKLIKCTPLSLMRAIMDAADLGLEPTGKYGGAYLVPFWSTRKSAYEATLIVGYDGLKELAYRSRIVTLVEGSAVREHDIFSYRRGWPESYLSHELPPPGVDRGDLVGAWAMVHLIGAPRPLMEFLPKDAIEKRRHVSKSGTHKDSGAPIGMWLDWADEMYAKTALRAVLDLSPKSVIEHVGRAFAIEDASDSNLGEAGADPRVLSPGTSSRRRRLQAGAGAKIDVEDETEGESALESPETVVEGEVTPESTDEASAAGAPETAPVASESPPVCGSQSPYADDETCGEPAGHPTTVIHRSFDGEGQPTGTWT